MWFLFLTTIITYQGTIQSKQAQCQGLENPARNWCNTVITRFSLNMGGFTSYSGPFRQMEKACSTVNVLHYTATRTPTFRRSWRYPLRWFSNLELNRMR
jgi:hypothetical protein